ncbi:hypothetical protein ALQ16_202297 [Pseudomonas syringae pv. actinidiae]|nr:hypothetical protein ALQ16_202297 [Pseudomonas syringae pv. actinidiae]
MRVQRAGCVKLATVDAITVAIARQARGAIVCGFGPQFSQRVAETHARQRLGIQPRLLLGAAVHAQHFKGIKMVLRNLAQRAISFGNQLNHLGQRHV